MFFATQLSQVSGEISSSAAPVSRQTYAGVRAASLRSDFRAVMGGCQVSPMFTAGAPAAGDFAPSGSSVR